MSQRVSNIYVCGLKLCIISCCSFDLGTIKVNRLQTCEEDLRGARKWRRWPSCTSCFKTGQLSRYKLLANTCIANASAPKATCSERKGKLPKGKHCTQSTKKQVQAIAKDGAIISPWPLYPRTSHNYGWPQPSSRSFSKCALCTVALSI